MIINSSKDIVSFFIGLLVGIGLCFIYDIIKSFRLANKSKNVSIFMQDILFFIISALVTYTLLFIRANGEIRWFLLVSELIGFSAFRFYISKHLVKLLKKFILFLKNKVVFPILSIFSRFSAFLNSKIDKIFVKI